MHPTLFGQPAFLIVVIAVSVVGAALHFALVRHFDLPRRAAFVYYVAAIVGAFVGAKLFAVALRSGVGTFDAELVSGFRYPGAIIGAAAALPLARTWAARDLPVLRWLDVLAPTIAFCMALIRVDCLLSGCCAGGLCHLPWAIHFPAGSAVFNAQASAGLIELDAATSLGVHPLQIYFMLASAVTAAILLWLLPRKRFDGQVILAFLVLHEGGKALLEGFRVPPIPELPLTSFIVAVAAGAAFVWQWRRVTTVDGVAGLAPAAAIVNHDRANS